MNSVFHYCNSQFPNSNSLSQIKKMSSLLTPVGRVYLMFRYKDEPDEPPAQCEFCPNAAYATEYANAGQSQNPSLPRVHVSTCYDCALTAAMECVVRQVHAMRPELNRAQIESVMIGDFHELRQQIPPARATEQCNACGNWATWRFRTYKYPYHVDGSTCQSCAVVVSDSLYDSMIELYNELNTPVEQFSQMHLGQ